MTALRRSAGNVWSDGLLADAVLRADCGLRCGRGGIDETRAAEYLTLANVPMVGGSWMVPRDAVAAGDWRRIRRLAERAAAIGRREAA